MKFDIREILETGEDKHEGWLKEAAREIEAERLHDHEPEFQVDPEPVIEIEVPRESGKVTAEDESEAPETAGEEVQFASGKVTADGEELAPDGADDEHDDEAIAQELEPEAPESEAPESEPETVEETGELEVKPEEPTLVEPDVAYVKAEGLEIELEQSSSEESEGAEAEQQRSVDSELTEEVLETEELLADEQGTETTADTEEIESEILEIDEQEPAAVADTEESENEPEQPPQDLEKTSELDDTASDQSTKTPKNLKKYSSILAIPIAFILLLGVLFAYTSLVPREVYATVDGKAYQVTSKAYTIEEFLEDEDISYCSDDAISMPVDTFIYDGIEFELVHATDFVVVADGKTRDYKTLEETVGEALADNNIEVGEKDIVTPEVNAALEGGMTITIQRVTTKQDQVEEEVDFETVEKDDSSLDEGSTKVVTEGVKGLDKVTYEYTYIDGVESDKKEVARETIKKPVDKVVAKGTRISYNGETYSRKLIVKAYSYTGGGRTAMGTKARVGEIAVDPKVIPLGSVVYIEGVGARKAEDTGGNIKGNTIDIYMNSVSQCRKWGARYVTIYIK